MSKQAEDYIVQQILGQNTTDRWSGQGLGSAEANARDMAKILAGIGITDIKQFGEIDAPADVEVTPVYGSRPGYVWGEFGAELVDTPYIAGYVGPDGKPVDSKIVKTVDVGPVTEADQGSFYYAAPVGTKKAFGNKVTGQVVPNTYSERQTGNAFGGTFAGKGNTGYRVQFSPDGTPVFYTTGASSDDNFFSDFGDVLKGTVAQVAPIILAATTFGAGGSALGSALGLGTGTTATAVGNALIQGAVAEASGGDFLKGAATGAARAFVPSVNAGISEALGGGAAANIAAGSLTGGALSNMAGGEFSTGALIGGAGAGVGEIRNDLRQEMFDTAMTESGLAGQTATSPSDFFLEKPNYENISIADVINNLQPFQPDYSLSSPELVPGLKPEFIETVQTPVLSENPTIAEIIDSLQPIEADYTFGNAANADIVDGSGLSVPVVPNLESMGGGQGLVMPVAGGYITQDGFIPDSYTPSIGDPNSFINQPPPQINYTLPEFTDQPPVDNSGKLAALGVAQTILPAVITAIAADSSAPKEADRPTGFDIVPIPGDWRPPEYNQQFTPSAPIDFGTLELLRGTQFERPLVRPTQMNYSIADIIAGIQGQYGQEATS